MQHRQDKVQLKQALARWHVPELPEELGETRASSLEAARAIITQKLVGGGDVPQRRRRQVAAAEWLYRLVRSNVKRGRAFALEEVLATGSADCLGYTRLLATLGPVFGLEMGVVEVLVDNAGRYVPHYVNLLFFSGRGYQFIDAWYGATNIVHQRIGALVNGKLRDIDTKDLRIIDTLQGLPDTCLEAIVLYVKGNRHLGRGGLDEAISSYSVAIKLYPNNSRAFYNRALAYEMKGEAAKARRDYARALRDESSLIRVMATIDEIESLILLDERGVSQREQDIYLWHKGFKTGEEVSYTEIARHQQISPEEVAGIIQKVEKICSE